MAYSEQSDTKSLAEAAPTHQLPMRAGWHLPLALFKNYWLNPNTIKSISSMEEDFKPRHDDIILASNPKCGTTWLKALAFAIVNRSHYGFADHPLLTNHPQQVVPTIEILGPGRSLDGIEKLPSPRLIATHLPHSLLPSAMTSCGCRIVYLCREPKDTFISCWHFSNNILGGSSPIGLDDALGMFCEGFAPYGPFWEHCLEYWKESLAKPQEILFLKYEELMCDPVKVVRMLASFFALPFSEEEERSGVPEELVKLCSFKTLSGLELNQTGHRVHRDNIAIRNSIFFRKGKVGDWENHMSREMARKLDDVVEEKLKGSGLVF